MGYVFLGTVWTGEARRDLSLTHTSASQIPTLTPEMGEKLVESQAGPGHSYPGQLAGSLYPPGPEGGAKALAVPVGWVGGPVPLPALSTKWHPSRGSGNPSGEPQRWLHQPAPQVTLTFETLPQESTLSAMP